MAEPTSRDAVPQTSDFGGSMFRDASGINIHGGTFNAYGSGGTDEKKRIADEKKRIAIALFNARVEQGAPYDAAAREDVPKCHEHTRVAIIGGIHKWAHSQEPDAPPLMWMYGPAGSGKTTIMQTVAETFDKEGSLAASFFFSRLSAARPKEKGNFVITLAHQLSLYIPALQQPLADALSDSSILSKSLVKQLDALVIGLLNKLDPDQIGPRCIFLVDGLDECDGDTAQRDVLDLLERFLHQAPHRVRILIASRPLSHLQAFFSQGSIREITRTTPLDNDYQSNGDITKFFTSKFYKIRGEHPSRGALPSEWPSRSDIDVLVSRASGQFIYASVVMKFIANHGRHPDESLQTIISLKAGGDERPYEELDAVYAQVLSTIEPQNVEFVQTLMGCLLIDSEKFHFAYVAQEKATTSVDQLFMIQPGTTDARINRIYPLITASSEGMKFSHASFPEYLVDRSRSKEFFLDMRKVHCGLASRWYKSYSSHFMLNPHSGIIPINVLERPFRRYNGIHHYLADSASGMILLDMVSHCLEAEWTSELRQDALTFDVHTVVRVGLEQSDDNRDKQHLRWRATFIWLDFIFWAEQHHLLSSAEAEHVRGCMKSTIRSVLSELSVSPTFLRAFAALLTWHNHTDIVEDWDDVISVMSDSDQRPLPYVDARAIQRSRIAIIQDHLRDASYLWLIQTFAGDTEMNGSFFVDGQLYTDVALLLAQTPVGEKNGYWIDRLKFMLSKALPSKELGTFLLQNFLQVRKAYFYRNYHEEVISCFLAIFIYLFECGIPFMSEHKHGPEFDHSTWVCGICLLFDPITADMELSQDPALPAQIADIKIHPPHELRLLHQVIPRVPLLWLHAWVLQLVNMLLRFFPVVA